MIPTQIDQQVRSSAEADLFRRMQSELSDNWTVLHSLGLTCHSRKPWSEIDFVLIGPQGIFCLEVKGGRIRRTEGVWTFTDRHDQVFKKAEGPFEQAASASCSLFNHLRIKVPQVVGFITGYGVATPDIRFDIHGPDIEPEIVYDVRDTGFGFDIHISRLSNYWRKRLRSTDVGEMPPGIGAKVLTELRGDFDLKPSLNTRIGIVKQELLTLTEQQYTVLDGLKDNSRAIIRGGAGTGKSLLATEEARRLAAEGKSVLLCCFNRALSRYLHASLSQDRAISVWSFHSLMAHLIFRAGLQDQIPSTTDESYRYRVLYPELALQALVKTNESIAFDALVLDEAQDLLLDGYLDVLDLLIKGGLKAGQWRAFIDSQQELFASIGSSGLKRLLDAHPAQFRLTVNCRNTASIAISTCILSRLPLQEVVRVEGPETIVEWFSDKESQRRAVSRFVGRVLSQRVRPNEIVILSERKLTNSSVAAGLLGVPSLIQPFDCDSPMSPDAVPFATVGQFKGLESDVVALVDIIDLDSDFCRNLLYVGASRARAQLAVFLDERLRKSYQDRAVQFGDCLAKYAGRGSV
jgi:hypothetical protein